MLNSLRRGSALVASRTVNTLSRSARGLLRSSSGVGSGLGAGAGFGGVGAGAGVGGGVGLGGSALLGLTLVRWATKKAAGSSSNKRDSPGKRLGIKRLGGQWVEPGHVLARQRGTKWHAGMNVALGRDHTITALISGHVRFTHTRRPWRDGAAQYRTWISVVPEGQDPALLRAWFDANQSRYLRTITDKFHGVPRSVYAPRERLAERLQREAFATAVHIDAERVANAGVRTFAVSTASGGSASLPPAVTVPLPFGLTPPRAHTSVTTVTTAHAALGGRIRKPIVKAYPTLITTTSTVPVTVSSQAPPAPVVAAPPKKKRAAA